MANIRLIRRRIKAARNISQITRAMEMVAASKMKKAQESALSSKPYAQKIYEATGELISKIKIEPAHYPLLRRNLAAKILVIFISSNKGLCGSLNSNLFRHLALWFPDKTTVDFVTLGKKGEAFVLRTGRNLLAEFSDHPYLESIGALINLIVASYTKEEYGQVCLVYNNFLSILNQTPVKKMILPITLATESQSTSGLGEFLIEPDIHKLLTALLPHYLEVEVRAAILEAQASEHSARMMAMKAATDNAKELMEGLTLEYNKMRQQLITYEIADMVTARGAVEG